MEVEHDGYSLVLDLGLPLDAGLSDRVPLPAIEAFRGSNLSRVAVLLSHGHPDHYGLITGVPPGVGVYLGEVTQRILKEARFFSPGGANLAAAGYLRDREPIAFGPFTVTPYLIDHSAFDSYSLLVEAGGRRLLYSGDLRAHGRKASVFERFVAQPPKDVDVLLLEGTNIRPETDLGPALSEQDVEERCVELFREVPGMVLACYSPQNIDRMVTLHRAARRSGRTLALDLYAAGIARATGRPQTIPQGDWNSVNVFAPISQRVKVKEAEEFERVARVRSRRLYPEDLAPRASELVMTFRDSMRSEIQATGCLEGAHAIWSMWPGYLEQPTGIRLQEWLAERKIPVTMLHASGHADPSDLRRYATAVQPRELVPVHTWHAERFCEFLDSVRVRNDGEWWRI